MNLESLCKEILEKAEAATKRPWTRETEPLRNSKIIGSDGFEIVVFPGPDSGDPDMDQQDVYNSDFIATAANNADKLARAVLVLRDTLNSIAASTEHSGTIMFIGNALAEAEKLME